MGTFSEILASCKALSDPTRIRILAMLSFAGAMNVNEIQDSLNMGQSRISRHLKIMTDAGILKSDREGTWIYYKVPESFPTGNFNAGLIQSAISSLEEEELFNEDRQRTNEIQKRRREASSMYFNKVGRNWETIQSDILNSSDYRGKVISFLPKKCSHLIDLGCGTGSMIPLLLERAGKVTGIDSSKNMIHSAKELFQKNKNVKFELEDLENVRLKHGTADALVASMVLHHISNPPLLLQKTEKALKENGVLVLVDLVKHNQEIMRDKYADLWLGFDPEDVRGWLNSAGFHVDKLEEINTKSVFKIMAIKAVKKGVNYVNRKG